MNRWLAPAIAVAVIAPAPALAADTAAAPVLFDRDGLAAMRSEAQRYPMFAEDLARTRASVDATIRAGINVPVPKDPGGGFTHEQHKRNYMALYGAGLLYRITGERRYADFARALLLAYAKLYPTLGPHPAKANEAAGRLFWQSLNDSVWLVYGIQGYDAIRDTLSAADRKTIDEQVFRRMAQFLSTGSADTFNRIHNHATWACAGVGMTGYVLRDPDLVAMALKGADKSGKAGFLRQLDLLFSPDGYYAEGPYYQRYALLPFVLFARAIQANEPERHIFAYRDGIVPKAVTTAIQLTYGGYFFPLNDAMRDKSLRTDELYHGVAIAYAVTKDPGLLGIAKWQGRTTLTPDGLAVARDVAGGKAEPFPFASRLFRDGPEGDRGGVAVMRSDASPTAEVLVAKNTAMGMGHGHFDKLSWILYDAGQPIVTDYGAARFLNIESKDGGRYLKENESWAKQTIAHNTLVVNETSHYGGKWRVGEQYAPRQLYFSGDGATKVSIAESDHAYPGVTFRRTLVQIALDKGAPLVLDLLRAHSDAPVTFDRPLHYNGHITDVGFALQSNVATRPVLGKAHGYQHIWVDATGTPSADNAAITWITGDRFYTYRVVPQPGTSIILGESGANDPRFNLRREPLLVERVTGAKDATFVALLEPHGAYDPSGETVVGSNSRVSALVRTRLDGAELVTITLAGGRSIALAIADDASAGAQHKAAIGGQVRHWTGPVGRFDGDAK